jgi:predicted RND superfamily exporter protein
MRRAYRRYCEWVFAKPRRAALVLFVLCLPALAADAQFFSRVRTGIADLLPRDTPSVKAIDAIHARLGGQSHLTVLAMSDSPEVNHRFIDELARRLEAANLPEVRSMLSNVRRERNWLKDHGALLLPAEQFDRLREALDTAVHAEKRKRNALLFESDDESTEPAHPWTKVSTDLDAEEKRQDRFPTGYLQTPDGKTVVLLIWLKGSDVELEPAARLLSAVKKEVADIVANDPRAPRVAYNGEVPNIVEEHDAILADLSFSSILVFVLVGGLIILYFRSLRSVLAVVGSLLPGLLFTFAIGRAMVGSLNSSSAFLGSIIAGNGINYPLLLLAYYRAQQPERGRLPAYVEASAQALPGTLGAAATASAAYGGLAVAHFRGFSEFGWIGGLGMITTWILTFVTMPIAVALIDPRRLGAPPYPEKSSVLQFFARPIAPWVAAGSFVAATLILTVIGVGRAAREGVFEMNIRALRNQSSIRSGSASWDRKANEVFGVWLNPVAALVDDPAKRQAAAGELRRVLLGTNPAMVERVDTIERYLPEPTEQEERLRTLRRAERLLTDAQRDEMPANVRALVDRWLRAENLEPITVEAIPPSLKQAFTEVDGRVDEAVLVFPSLAVDYDDARNVLRLSDEMTGAQLPPGTLAGGSFLFMADVIRLLQKEAFDIILVVCALVALVLVPIFAHRPQRIPFSVVTIAAVAVCSQAMMLAVGVKVNMFNFAAVPITIGVGSDYVVNLFGAMDAFHTDARHACARMGGAILLCSMTTVVGYLSLVFAQSGALRTFGWAAVLGEVMAVVTVLLLVPVLSRRRIGARAPHGTEVAA